MTFKPKYSEEDFLKVLSPTYARSTAAIEKEVGCAKSTAKLFLAQLESSGKIKGVYVDGVVCGWLKNS